MRPASDLLAAVIPARETWRRPERTCEDCGGTGWLYDTARGVLTGRCRCSQGPLEKRQESAGIPVLERRARFDEVRPEVRERADKLQRYFDAMDARRGPGQSLLFVGPVGTGKTWLAACAANWALIRGWSVAWRKATQWLADLRSSYDADSRTHECDVNRPLRRAKLLVLNDLGAEKVSPWVATQVEDLLDDRISAELPTIVTTNLSHEELREAYGDRTASRLGPRFYRHVQFDGADIRGSR